MRRRCARCPTWPRSASRPARVARRPWRASAPPSSISRTMLSSSSSARKGTLDDPGGTGMSAAVLPAGLVERVRGWRHDLHRIPETAFGEHETSGYIASVLGELGFEVATGIGGTGLVGSLTLGGSGRAVGLRSELDALPIAEQSGVEYASRHEGTMHACGHDGHMA